MSISKCIVRLKDCHNTEHSVEVYAESLYEAVLRGLSRLEVVGKMDMAERVGFEPDACDGWGREGTNGAVLDATPLKTLILNWRRDLLS